MEIIETILRNNIDKPGALFIFPTDVAASRWADHLLRLRGGGTIAMNKFIAWDTFKQNSVRSKVQNKKSVPQALRKIFISSLIRKNAELCGLGKPPVFSSLIRSEWAAEAASFAPWLTELLPQLGAWFKKSTGLDAALITAAGTAKLAEGFEGDDRDLFTIALSYAQFLEAHGLFEPAWEAPPFDDTGKECFIFFPESLSDFGEYRNLLAASGHVKTVSAGGEERDCDVFYYTNSRSEITEAALYIRALHENAHVPWDSIVVSITDTENYEPYVLREFANRNIPYVKRTGKPLSAYPAGQFFRAVADCASRGFAFSALAGLLLNSHLPWKDGAEIQTIIDFGINNNCISSWVEEEDGKERPVNIWEESFAEPLGGIDPAARRFFGDLKRRVNALRSAVSFAELRRQYFIFRERFLDMKNCPPGTETDLVFSRCISELMYLAEIEKSFPDVKAPDPFMFFVENLSDITYLAQQKTSGVVILPYRTAAPAPFDCHVILGASQDKLSAVFTRLGFLPRNKREKLGLADEDASAAFIGLHRCNSKKNAAFFCAEHTFSGYAIPHSLLRTVSGAGIKPRQRYAQDPAFREKFANDLFLAEDVLYSGGGGGAPAPLLHENQLQGFEAWRSRRQQPENPGGSRFADKALLDRIREAFCYNKQFPGKYSVSATSLESYYQCSLKWLFNRVLALENVQIEASLMAKNIIGQVYHAVLNLFFTELKKDGGALAAPVYPNGAMTALLPDTYRDLLKRSTDAVFAAFPCLFPGGKPVMSALGAKLLGAEKKHFHAQLEKCLGSFLSYFAGCRVTETETNYQSEQDFYFLNGKADCLLEDIREDSPAKGTGIIVDFKLYSMPDRAECTGEGENGLVNFQLPMYLGLAEKEEAREMHTALFFSIVKTIPEVIFGVIQDVNAKKPLPKKEEDRILRGSESYKRIMKEFWEKAGQFAEEIKSGVFTVFPFDSNQCNECYYHRVCRTAYTIDREQNLTTWGKGNESE